MYVMSSCQSVKISYCSVLVTRDRKGIYGMRAGWDGMGISLTRIYDPANTIREKAFITCISVTVPAPIFLVADVFGNDIFH
jgi:hypothetical protein